MMLKRVAIAVLLLAGALAWTESTAAPSSTPASIPDMLSAGRVDDALRALTIRLKTSPSDAEAYHLLSRSYFALQKWDEAVNAGEKAAALAPNNSEYHMWLGRAYAEKADHASFVTAAGLTKKIRQEFERAVELDASNLSARSDLAEFYLEAPSFLGGGRGKAEKQAQAIAQRDSAAAHWLQARIAEKDKDLTAAEKEYRAAIEASHNQGSYWLNLASFYKRQGRLNDMESAISSAIQADKKKPNVFYDAAQLLFGAGRNFVAATQFIRKYLAGPTEEAPAFQAHYLLGEILEKQGNKQAAEEEYRAALALAKDYTRAKEALARVTQH